MTEYRLSFEAVTPFAAPHVFSGETFVGPLSTIPEGAWHRTEMIVQDKDDVEDQWRTLTKWARTQEEPIRNVKLEYRETGEWAAVT